MQSDSNEQLHLAARLYYVDGWDQAQVAELVRVSQAKVSRLLSLARKKGIVRITVSDYDSRQRIIESELIQQLGLKATIVVKAMENLPVSKVRILMAHFAAPLLETLIPPSSVLAIGCGMSLQSIVHQLPMTTNGSTVVQAVGRTGTQASLFDAQELGRSLAEKWEGDFHLLNAPVYLPNKSAFEALLKLDQIQNLRQRLRQATVALVEIHSPSTSPFADSLDRQQQVQLESAQAVGEICGRYFNRQGRECETSLMSQTSSIDFQTLRATPQVIGVAIGTETAEAILGAIQGGLISCLITDESTAKATLELASQELAEKKTSLHYHLS